MAARWGSFLQQAVAGVESRLDNILGETEEVPQQAKADGHSPAPQRTATTQPENGTMLSVYSASLTLTFQNSDTSEINEQQPGKRSTARAPCKGNCC